MAREGRAVLGREASALLAAAVAVALLAIGPAPARAETAKAEPPPRDLRQERPGGRRPREPRPRIRPAREVLEDLAKEKLWTPADLAADKPRAEIERLGQAGGEVTIEGMRVVTETAGPLPARVYDVRVRLAEDMIARVADDLDLVPRAMALVGVRLADVLAAREPRDPLTGSAPPRMLAGDLRIAALGFDGSALEPGGGVAELAEAKRWLDARRMLGPPVEAAIGSLEPEAFLTCLTATAERLEVRVTGLGAEEAKDIAARIGDALEVAALYGSPALTRKGGMTVIALDRKP